MNLADYIILLSLVIVLVLPFLKKKNSSGCTGSCAACQGGCSRIDWEQIKKDIHK